MSSIHTEASYGDEVFVAEGLRQRALNGDPSAMDRIGGLVGQYHTPFLVNEMLEILFHQVSRSLKIPRNRKLAAYGRQLILDTTTLHAVRNELKDCREDESVMSVVIAYICKPGRWRDFWAWTREIASTAIEGTSPRTEESDIIVEIVDGVYSFLASHSKDMCNLMGTTPGLMAFITRMWLIAEDRENLLFLMPFLLSHQGSDRKPIQAHMVAQFCATIGGTDEEVSAICIRHLTLLPNMYRPGCDMNAEMARWFSVLYMLSSHRPGLAHHLVGAGSVWSAFRTLSRVCLLDVSLDTEDLQDTRHNVTLIIRYLDQVVCLGPSYAAKVIKAGFYDYLFSVILPNPKPAVVSSDHFREIHTAIHSNIIRQFTSYSVLRQVLKFLSLRPERNAAAWKAAGSDYGFALFEFMMATLLPLKAEYEAMKIPPCYNSECPRRSRRHRNYHVRFCQGCMSVKYCSENCQRNMWKSHRDFCRAVSRERQETIVLPYQAIDTKDLRFFELMIEHQVKQTKEEISELVKKFKSGPSRDSEMVVLFDFTPSELSPLSVVPLERILENVTNRPLNLEEARGTKKDLTCGMFTRGQVNVVLFLV